MGVGAGVGVGEGVGAGVLEPPPPPHAVTNSSEANTVLSLCVLKGIVAILMAGCTRGSKNDIAGKTKSYVLSRHIAFT